MTRHELRVGSVIRNLIGDEWMVDRFEGIFTIIKMNPNSDGEVWLVDSHMEGYEIVKY